jgi:hypothetical protein
VAGIDIPEVWQKMGRMHIPAGWRVVILAAGLVAAVPRVMASADRPVPPVPAQSAATPAQPTVFPKGTVFQQPRLSYPWEDANHAVFVRLLQSDSDLVALATAALAEKPKDGPAALQRLIILLDAGLFASAAQAVRGLPQFYPDAGQLNSTQLYNALDAAQAWDAAAAYLEIYGGQFVSWAGNQTHGQIKLIEAWYNAGKTTAEIDAWLAARSDGTNNYWLQQRVLFLSNHGDVRPVLGQFEAAARAQPADYAAIIRYLDAERALPSPFFRDALNHDGFLWLPPLNGEFGSLRDAEIGARLKQIGQNEAAAVFLQQALAKPLDEAETKVVVHGNSQFYHLSYLQQVPMLPEGIVFAATGGYKTTAGNVVTPEALAKAQEDSFNSVAQSQFEQSVRDQCVACLQALGRGDEASKIGQQAEMTAAIEPRGQRSMAGALPAAITPAAPPLTEDNYRYWLDQANYLNLAGDAAGAEAAYKKALTLAPPQPGGLRGKGYSARPQVLSDYTTQFLAKQQRYDDVLQVYRTELADAPPDSDSAEYAAMQLARQGRGFFLQSGDMKMKEYFAFQDRINKEFAINPNDELFWHWLAACQEWEWGQEQLLSAMMQAANKDPAFSKRVDELAMVPDATASRQFVAGKVLAGAGENALAVSLFKQAIAKMDAKNYRRSDVIEALYQSYVALGDWRSAEPLLPQVVRMMTFDGGPSPSSFAGNLALLAAQDHAAADALRLWKRATNLDLLYTGQLAKLAALGLGDALRAYYAEVAKELPESVAPARALVVLP